MEVNCYEIPITMTLDEFKCQIAKEYYVPTEKQNVTINGIQCSDGSAVLKEIFGTNDNVKITIAVGAKQKRPNAVGKIDSESDDESQNEKVGVFDVAAGVDKKSVSPKLKIDEEGWECPLCTLINQTARNECLACSTTRPSSHKLQTKLKEIEYHLKVNEDLRTFFDMNKVELRPKKVERNDLNKSQSANRKSSDLFNILVEDKNLMKMKETNPIVVTAAVVTAAPSPNITKNKYRGVDNFNPYKSYLFPTNNCENRKPIITNVIYKSSQLPTKDIKSKSHYQELVNLEVSDIVTNLEKFECPICFVEIEAKGGAVLRDCLHTFCKPCLESHIDYSDEAEIKCPYIDDVYSCPSLLSEREIRGLVSKEQYEKHLSRSIRLAENKIENTYHCKTPNCKGWCIFEDTTNSFKCPVCTIVNCITCGVSFQFFFFYFINSTCSFLSRRQFTMD
jgi:RING-type zinc-finger/Zn-finger in Ran binding protein and others